MAGYAVFMTSGAAYFLLAGVLAGNVWEAWQRVHRRSGGEFAAKLAVFLREITPLRGR